MDERNAELYEEYRRYGRVVTAVGGAFPLYLDWLKREYEYIRKRDKERRLEEIILADRPKTTTEANIRKCPVVQDDGPTSPGVV